MSARVITCDNCGERRFHAAKKLCRSCYQKKTYHDKRDHELERRGKLRHKKLKAKHAELCKGLREIMLPMIPNGETVKHISWDQAAGIYNTNNPSPVHYLALCRAVQFQGHEWGLKSEPKPIGGVTITREI